MPELPDVEIFKREVAEEAKKESIKDISVEAPSVVKGISPAGLTKKLTGRKITAVSRHGKNIFMQISNVGSLRLHFGMTGSLVFEEDQGELPKHTCLALHFKSGNRLVYVDPRKFGAIQFIDDIDEYLERMKIGPDVETLNEKEFRDILSKRRGLLKPALMDQSLMSGLGNVYTDEVLFQSRLHPEKEIRTLTPSDYKNLYKKTRAVIREAIKDRADRDKMPKGFLIHHRSAGETCPGCKNSKVHMKQIGGRSTYFCPKCQVK